MLMSIRSRSHVKASMVLTRADHLFTPIYIRSLLNNILRHILMIVKTVKTTGSNPLPTVIDSDALAN